MVAGDNRGGRGPQSGAGRWWLLAVLAAGVAAFFLLGLDRWVRLDTLRMHQAEIGAFVAEHRLAALMLFAAIYVVCVALSVPGATALSVAGGFLFGTWIAAPVVVVAATLGATLLFLIARSTFGAALRRRAGPRVRQLEAGFRRHAFSYLLILRLVPLFPFFLVNIVPALLGVPARTFALATLIGIVPGALVYTGLGSGAGVLIEGAALPGAAELFLRREVVLPVAGLIVLALLPIAYHHMRGRLP